MLVEKGGRGIATASLFYLDMLSLDKDLSE